MSQLVVLVSIVVHHDDAEAFQVLVAALMRATRDELGCIESTVSRAIDVPLRYMITERWQDAAALEAHFTTAHMSEFRAAARALRIERREAMRYAVASAEAL